MAKTIECEGCGLSSGDLPDELMADDAWENVFEWDERARKFYCWGCLK